ncbi:transposase [Cellulomonas fimi]|uniref:transposase n=1 Tax=Cellulomonas fimi TaxID=1708 RepID=UPI00234D04B2|nr:transposase [Cellulomonas fimi]
MNERAGSGTRVRGVDIAAMVATAVNKDGHREVLGVEVSTAEDSGRRPSARRGTRRSLRRAP